MLKRKLKPLHPDGDPAHKLFRTNSRQTIFVKYILSELDDRTDWAFKEFVMAADALELSP